MSAKKTLDSFDDFRKDNHNFSDSGGSLPPQSPTNRGGANLHIYGEDWIQLSLYILWTQDFKDFFTYLETQKKKCALSGVSKLPVKWKNCEFYIRSKGEGKFKYRIDWRGYEFSLSDFPEPLGDWPNGKFTARGDQMTKLIHVCFAWKDCEAFINALGGTITMHLVSRVDLRLDLLNQPVVPFNRCIQYHRFICRGRATGYYSQLHQVNKKETGLTIGKGGIRLRIYDKIAEVQGNVIKQALLEKHILFHSMSDLDCWTRVEFQLRRTDGLKGWGVNTVEDWINYKDRIFKYLVTQWVRFLKTKPDPRQPKRTKNLDAWNKVIDFTNFIGVKNIMERNKDKNLEVNTEQLFRQGIGCLIQAFILEYGNLERQRDNISKDSFFVFFEKKLLKLDAKNDGLESLIQEKVKEADRNGQIISFLGNADD